MPLSEAQQLGQHQAIMKCLIDIHGARSPPLPPVLPWLPLKGRVLKDPVYDTPHAEHSWGAAVAASLVKAVNSYRATQTGRAAAAIKAVGSLVDPLDTLAARSDYDNPHDNPDAFAALAESMGLGSLLVSMRATRGNAARGSIFAELPQRSTGGRAAAADAQPATDVDTDEGATTRAAAAADARREELRAALGGLTVPDLLKLGSGVAPELILTVLAGHAMACGVHDIQHVISVGDSVVSIRSVHDD